MNNDSRQLLDLYSIGPAAVKDFHLLKIKSVDDLRNNDANNLYNQLCRITKTKHDPCVIDVFRCAIEQAKDPKLDRIKCDWWYWTQFRKKSEK